jgi:hypothetical protein
MVDVGNLADPTLPIFKVPKVKIQPTLLPQGSKSSFKNTSGGFGNTSEG